MDTALDRIDRLLLKELQRNNQVTAAVLAEQIGTSRSVVQRRLRRLRSFGVIEADISVVSPASIGRPMTFIISLSLEREQADLIEKFKKAMAAHDAVQQCYYVTGDTDFVVVLTARDIAEYDQIINAIFLANANIKRFQTNVVVKAVKTGTYVPIPAP